MSDTVANPSSMKPATKLPKQRFRSGRNAIFAGLNDFFSGLWNVGLWRELAWEDFVKRYRRSYFGVLWAVASFAVLSIAILFFFSALTGENMRDGVSYIVIGFLVFQLLSMALTDGCNVFTQSAAWISSARLPMSVFVFKDIARISIVFVFNALGAAIVLAWHGYRLPPGWEWSLAGLAVNVFNAVWVFLFLGVIVARFRDIFHLVGTIMRLAFFISPVMWIPTGEGMRSLIALYNPFTHFISIVRDPLLGQSLPMLSWQIVAVITAVGWLAGLLTFCLLRRRVIYWV